MSGKEAELLMGPISIESNYIIVILRVNYVCSLELYTTMFPRIAFHIAERDSRNCTLYNETILLLISLYAVGANANTKKTNNLPRHVQLKIWMEECLNSSLNCTGPNIWNFKKLWKMYWFDILFKKYWFQLKFFLLKCEGVC